ncbi:MAG TPA: iron-sulfur cluster repair di-iron protein [Nitrospira sp.]|nr:iron-sulfur cluster repair di-iron protein [Nitrospira sp.]
MVITSETPVRDIAVAMPTAIPMLERIGIDYCCHGQHTLTEACARKDIALAPVLEELDKLQPQSTGSEESRWAHAPLKELSEHIVKRHHAYTREHLKLIDTLMAKVEQRHGAEHPEVFQLGKALAVFGSELKHHTECEETNLFPYIAAIGTDQLQELPAPAMGSLKMPISHMMADHDQAGEDLQTLRKLTNNYTPPPEACPTWRGLYSAIEELEADLHQHIHLENNILFPRAIKQAESEVQKTSAH